MRRRFRRILLLLLSLGLMLIVSGLPAMAEQGTGEENGLPAMAGQETGEENGLPATAGQETGEEKLPEWTVMLYLCGSDLESRHSYATGNLREILTQCNNQAQVGAGVLDAPIGKPADQLPTEVNVLVQTGGAAKWHAEELGMKVNPGALQRWQMRWMDDSGEADENRFELKEELPLESMADPGPLASFIRWGKETCPAKKYCLVLWGHALGSRTGIFIDELFTDDIMYLYELQNALEEGGVCFETLVFDACLMANLETAFAVRNNARWMIASEELVAGRGTAVGEWIQQLIFTPGWDGRRLGRWICHTTEEKYASGNDNQSRDLLTWSVINLSRIDHLAEMFDRLYDFIGDKYVNEPLELMAITLAFRNAFEFGMTGDSMIDLTDVVCHPAFALMLEPELYEQTVNALMEAVDYNAHGQDRTGAEGLSFCHAANLSATELNQYALNCFSPHYLAFLDAIIPGWEAPDSLYEQVPRLPPIEEHPAYQIQLTKRISEDGSPGVVIRDGFSYIDLIYANLIRLNPETGNLVRMGIFLTEPGSFQEDGGLPYTLREVWRRPALEGVLCDAELVTVYRGEYVYNIPLQIDGETFLMRCGIRLEEGQKPKVYGLWEGYDGDGRTFNRNVIPLSGLAGREYSLLYPIEETENGNQLYEVGEPMTMYRSLELTEKKLEPGTYFIEFYVADIFGRMLPVGWTQMDWDGERISVPEDGWKGDLVLLAPSAEEEYVPEDEEPALR